MLIFLGVVEVDNIVVNEPRGMISDSNDAQITQHTHNFVWSSIAFLEDSDSGQFYFETRT